MSKILGLDLGQNSIGWAIVDEGKITEMGTKIFHSKVIKQVKNKTLLQLEFEKIKILPITQKITILIIIATTILTLVNISNWQFWLGLDIASLLTYLTMKK